MGERIDWGQRRGAIGGYEQAAASIDLAALDRLIGWQADTEGRLRDATFFEPQRLAGEEVLRCVFTRTTVDSDYLQWSRTNNDFALFIDGVENTLWSGNDLLVAGYLRVGSLSAPTNVIDGDLTCVRLNVGNVAFGTGVESVLGGDATLSGFLRVGSNTAPTSTTAGDLTFIRAFVNDDPQFAIYFSGANPQIVFDANDFLLYTRATDTLTFSLASVSKLTLQATALTVGVDGSAPQLVLAAIDGTNEGGEMVFNGAAANTDWTLDNSTGEMRLSSGVTVYHQWSTTFFRSAGYGRYGSVAQPTNTTAGDLTAIRLMVGTDTTFPANIEAYINTAAGNAFRVDTASTQRFQVDALAVRVGADGSAPQLLLAAVDGTNEGGEMVINGAAANIDWTFDNNTGNLRWFESSAVRLQLFSGASPAARLRVLGTLLIDSDLDHDGSNIGFFGVPVVARAAAYTVTNRTADRAYDADATTVAELADVLGTVIDDLRNYGLLQY